MSHPDTSRVPRDSLRISSIERPGWRLSPDRVPEPGEQILCLDGQAEVVRVLGRTSDGSRLLELRCESRPQPFFASSSNVLVRSDEEEPSVFLDPSQAVGGS
jgi:hypothetical protein